MRKVELAGQRFGKLTVIEKVGIDPHRGYVIWKCRCDCGRETTATSGALRQGKRTGCGCTNTRSQNYVPVSGKPAVITPPAEVVKQLKETCPYYDRDFLIGCRILNVRICEKKGRCGFYDQAVKEGRV